MKKLFVRDKKLRDLFLQHEKKKIILKTIFQNSNLFILLRWNAFLRLRRFGAIGSFISFSNRCIYTINKKRLNKTSLFSRHVLLKLIRSGKMTGITKSSW